MKVSVLLQIIFVYYFKKVIDLFNLRNLIECYVCPGEIGFAFHALHECHWINLTGEIRSVVLLNFNG